MPTSRADVYSLGADALPHVERPPAVSGQLGLARHLPGPTCRETPIRSISSAPMSRFELAAPWPRCWRKSPHGGFRHRAGEVAQALTPFFKKTNVTMTEAKPVVFEAGPATPVNTESVSRPACRLAQANCAAPRPPGSWTSPPQRKARGTH